MPPEAWKHFKVNVHSKNHYPNADLIINRKDFPDIQQNDIVEIYHPEDEFSRLLLQVTAFRDDLQGKDVVSVEQGVASTFQLRSFSDVVVRKVDFHSVVLDSLEVTFKDQYLGRSEMWRLRNSIIKTCVYLNKKIEFGNARVQVCEMWCQGERVACGVISEETKIVFRSSTSMVYLFVQMSSEMWEFDIHGDLYFEKAINGFLADLFQKWKKYGSNHEVTIVLFSRVFYKANSVDEFPEYMRECLQKDYKNQFYEDFYRVAVQNEKYDDWNCSLALLQSLFTEYRQTILEYHKRPDCRVPTAYLSTAAHGNFLEVLNISLNVFDKHYLERSMDRTGQLSVVISPGVGVFEVDRELTNVTKQRIIDNGVGCDLVCIGEQPLHAVPLFKFHNKDKTILRNDYSMPHWINLSFYSGNKRLAFSKFVPRIRLPSRHTTSRTTQTYPCSSPINSKAKLPTSAVEETSLLGCSTSTADVDYDAYDDQVFSLPSSHIESVQKLFSRTRKLSHNQDTKAMKWKLSDPDIYRSTIGITRSTSITSAETNSTNELPRSSFIHCSGDRMKNQGVPGGEESHCARGMVAASVDSGPKKQFQNSPSQELESTALGPGRALVNPFDPSHVTVKITSNRRRWTHIFPKGPSGYMIQQHHYQPEYRPHAELNRDSRRTSSYETNPATEYDFHLAGFPPISDCKLRSKTSTCVGSPNSSPYLSGRKSQTLLWGATGEQRWTPTLTTGVDWKSLVVPACLPITTDYFPDEVCLKTDYVFSDYNLLPDDVNADYARKRAIYRAPLTTQQVFFELISQRLAQGFQLIVENDTSAAAPKSHVALVPKYVSKDATTECKLSIGRIFHRITLCGSEIRITRYRPRFPYPPFKIPYRYRFQAPDHSTYGISEAAFEAEKLENFNWNYLDHYICTRGDTDFALVEGCKYWRFRLYVLPSVQPGTKKILDGAAYCDVYTRSTHDEKLALLEGFLRFIESPVNKVRRTLMQKPSLKMASSGSTSTAFRDRLGSISRERMMRPRSVSKMSDKQRVSPVVDVMPSTSSSTPANVSVDVENNDVFETGLENVKITKESLTSIDLVDMMSHPSNGVNFLSKSPSLPSCTFISYDAVQWLRKHWEGVLDEKEAVEQFEELRRKKLICHASGDFAHPFLFGFFLYYIPHRGDESPKDKVEFIEPINDVDTFKNEWAEVKMLPVATKNRACPQFLLEDSLFESMHKDGTSDAAQVPSYKEAYLEIDPNNRSDRIEWGHFRYQSIYRVEDAYELIIKWIAASGPIVSDLIYSLARKSQTYNLQLIPVPADPHALPYALKSDPLRGPIFVPLNISCLLDEAENVLFERFAADTRPRRILLLLGEIASRFGFILCRGGSEYYSRHLQYVHLTGNIFLLITIPSKKDDSEVSDQNDSLREHTKRRTAGTSRGRMKTESEYENESTINPHEKYVMKRLTERHDKYKTDNRTGYLWSWNHMIGRRWKGSNAATNDEAFQDKLLLDFQKFCSNDEDRLRSFWDACTSSLEGTNTAGF